MTSFEEFSEMLERGCFNSWRSAVGKDDEVMLSRISSVLFTKEELPSKWRFSFALRRDGRWVQCSRDVEPVEYDPYDPPPIDDFDPVRSVSPQNLASTVASEMLSDISRRVFS